MPFSGYGIPLGLSSPGLIVLDLMRLFCDPSSPAHISFYPRIEGRLFQLVDRALAAGRPVLFMRHAHKEGDDGGMIGRMHGRLQKAGDALNALVAGAKQRIPPAYEIIKNRHSAFASALSSRRLLGCDSVLIAGVQTHACVLATALDASRLGLVPVVVSDACVSRDERLHHATLEVLAAEHAFVVETGAAISAFLDRGAA